MTRPPRWVSAGHCLFAGVPDAHRKLGYRQVLCLGSVAGVHGVAAPPRRLARRPASRGRDPGQLPRRAPRAGESPVERVDGPAPRRDTLSDDRAGCPHERPELGVVELVRVEHPRATYFSSRPSSPGGRGVRWFGGPPPERASRPRLPSRRGRSAAPNSSRCRSAASTSAVVAGRIVTFWGPVPDAPWSSAKSRPKDFHRSTSSSSDGGRPQH